MMAQVVVSVLDINDNDPIFPFSMFTFDVLEDAQVGSQVGVVSATDADEGNNGVITYFIDSFTQQLQQGQTGKSQETFPEWVSCIYCSLIPLEPVQKYFLVWKKSVFDFTKMIIPKQSKSYISAV